MGIGGPEGSAGCCFFFRYQIPRRVVLQELPSCTVPPPSVLKNCLYSFSTKISLFSLFLWSLPSRFLLIHFQGCPFLLKQNPSLCSLAISFALLFSLCLSVLPPVLGWLQPRLVSVTGGYSQTYASPLNFPIPTQGSSPT